MLYKFFEKTSKKIVEPKSCYLLDVFNNEFFTAPKALKRISDDIEAACEEIADRWERI